MHWRVQGILAFHRRRRGKCGCLHEADPLSLRLAPPICMYAGCTYTHLWRGGGQNPNPHALFSIPGQWEGEGRIVPLKYMQGRCRHRGAPTACPKARG